MRLMSPQHCFNRNTTPVIIPKWGPRNQLIALLIKRNPPPNIHHSVTVTSRNLEQTPPLAGRPSAEIGRLAELALILL